MTFHVDIIHEGRTYPIKNHITQRESSWPTYEAAQRYIDDCEKHGVWARTFGHEPIAFAVREHSRDTDA